MLVKEGPGYMSDLWYLLIICMQYQCGIDTLAYEYINTLRPRQNGRHFGDDTFNRIFVYENVTISIKFSLKFVPKGPINNIPALVQIMAWRRPGDKPLSEPVMVSLLTHICVTRPQWVRRSTVETLFRLTVCRQNMATAILYLPQGYLLLPNTR